MYAEQGDGAGGKTFIRTTPATRRARPTTRPRSSCSHRSRLDDVLNIVVRDEAQAKRTAVALEQLGVPLDRFDYAICAEFFDTYGLSGLMRRGSVRRGSVGSSGLSP